MRTIWITWEKQRRNASMAAGVGATLHELDYRGNRLARYFVLGIKTIRLATRRDVDVVIFQNPSIVLSTLITLLKVVGAIKGRTIGDFHNAGLLPPVAQRLVPWIVRHTDLVIVSNRNLEATVVALGGRCASIPDPLPHIAPDRNSKAGGNATFEVLFICSWADDEPIVEVLRAAQLLEPSDGAIRISITGRPKLAQIQWTQPVPANVKMTGFLAEHDFERRLAASALVLDLTTRADCMVCGAYEAVAAEIPAVLSDNQPTRLYFDKGMLYTDNSAASIARCILEGKAVHQTLRRDVQRLKGELTARDATAMQTLREFISAPRPR